MSRKDLYARCVAEQKVETLRRAKTEKPGYRAIFRFRLVAADRSVGVFASKHDAEGCRQNAQVQPHRPFPDVLQIALNPVGHFVERVRFASKAANLRQTGDSRTDIVAASMTGRVFAKVLR